MRSHSTRMRILAFTLALVTVATGCNSNQVLAYLEAIAPSAIAALQLVAAFQGAGVSSGVVQNINQEAANVIDLYKKFQAASGDAKKDAKSQFNAAFVTFQTNLQEVFATTRINDPSKQAKVDAVVAALFVLVNQVEAAVSGNPANQQALRKSGLFYSSPEAFHKDFDKKLKDAQSVLNTGQNHDGTGIGGDIAVSVNNSITPISVH